MVGKSPGIQNRDTAVQRLVGMGFDKAQSTAMPKLTDGDVERALELLL